MTIPLAVVSFVLTALALAGAGVPVPLLFLAWGLTIASSLSDGRRPA